MSSSAFWDKIADKYSKQPVPDEAIYQKKLNITQEYLHPNSHVLELACGTGTTALHHAPVTGHIRAVDISENMIAIAKEKQEKAGIENVNFECCDLDSLEFEAQSYDLVMAHSILHLVENREQVISQVSKMLKPGGIFISSTVCLSNKNAWLKPVAYLMGMLGTWPKVSFFTDKQLSKEIVDRGFTIEQHWLPAKRFAAVFIVAKKAA